MDIRALYEMKRQNFLIGYIQSPDRFDDALAFAYENRIAPIFHEDIMKEVHGEDPFVEAYAVKPDFMLELIKYIDKCWLDKNLDEVEFRKLEDKFGGYKANRIEIIHTVEYARISGRFDDDVYSSIVKDAPIEANSIRSSFSPSEVHFS